MRIVHHMSGSKGNAFTIERANDKIQIDAGADLEPDYLLITHTHGDHIKFFTRMVAAGTKWFAPSPLKEQILNLKHGSKHIEELYERPPGIESFGLYHDTPTFGYVVWDGDESYCHITDTGDVDIDGALVGHTAYSIESNYDEESLWDSGRPDWLKQRISQTHLSNEQAIQIAEELATEDTRIIQFIHMSSETNLKDKAQYEHALSTLKRRYDLGVIYETKEDKSV